MKKLVLLGLTLFSIIASKSSFAQSFSFPKDTVMYAIQGYLTEDIHNDIKNDGTAPVNLSWKIVADNLHPSWETNFALCDNVLCYNNNILTGTTQNMSTINPGATATFKVSTNFDGVEKGTYFVTVEVSDGTNTKDMTFMMTKFPTSVSSTKPAADGISLYPNPASDELNVRFNAASGVSHITVYNMIGKALTVYKVSAANSAKLDIQNIPAGIYFIRLSDAQGRLVATRKFTHQ